MTNSALYTVAQLALAIPAFTQSSIRWAIFNEKCNGLAASGAILRVGSKVLIDRELFETWLRSNPRLSPPKPSRRTKRVAAARP